MICARHGAVTKLHVDRCVECGTGGDLLCCDSCPAAVHLQCILERECPDYIAAEHQELFANGTVLRDDATLFSYNLRDSDAIDIKEIALSSC